MDLAYNRYKLVKNRLKVFRSSFRLFFARLKQQLLGRQTSEEKPQRHKSIFDLDERWPKIGQLPVDKLEMLDLNDALNSMSVNLKEPLNETRFLKEIGYTLESNNSVRVSEDRRNNVILRIIEPLLPLLETFSNWKLTSSHPEDTYKTVDYKIDRAPCEDHKHFGRMWECYRAISSYILEKCPDGLKRRSDEQVIDSTNRKGAIGRYERQLSTYNNMGEYIGDCSGVWRQNVRVFKEKLLQGKPIDCVLTTSGKREVKKSLRGRLVSSPCPTARLYENQILGNLDELLKKLPYCVSGIPQSRYGQHISTLMKNIQNSRGVCDDVAGWDTKISYSILCLEAAFLQSLTKEQSHKDEIKAICRLYAYPLIWIDRVHEGKIHRVLFQTQGQVASGKRVTYAMNTITNIVVTMCRAAISQGISVDQMYSWSMDKLKRGHSDCYGGVISGDDSVILMSKANAIKYATIGAGFMDAIGMPRKDRNLGQASIVYKNLCDMNFCGHKYSLVKFGHRPSALYYRWVRDRDISEILAKCSIVKKHNIQRDSLHWARAQAIGMLIEYFSNETIRLIALAILSAIPRNCCCDTLPKDIMKKPWFSESYKELDVLGIFNRFIFDKKKVRDGVETFEDSPYRLDSLNDLTKVRVVKGPKNDGIDTTSEIYIDWRKSLPDLVKDLRQLPANEYDDLLPHEFYPSCLEVASADAKTFLQLRLDTIDKFEEGQFTEANPPIALFDQSFFILVILFLSSCYLCFSSAIYEKNSKITHSVWPVWFKQF